MKKILLLGDSIRLSYQSSVSEKLKDIAKVVGPAENCQFSQYTLESLPLWIDKFGKPNIVHWNNGLHDVGHNPNRIPIQIPLLEYAANLESILALLMQTGAKIIWATITPVHPNRSIKEDEWSWKNCEIDLYNEAALAVMKKYDLPVNDLSNIVKEDYSQYLCEDLLHLSQEGIEKCSEAVAHMIKKSI